MRSCHSSEHLPKPEKRKPLGRNQPNSRSESFLSTANREKPLSSLLGSSSTLRTAYIAAHHLLGILTSPREDLWSATSCSSELRAHEAHMASQASVQKPEALANEPDIKVPGGSISSSYSLDD